MAKSSFNTARAEEVIKATSAETVHFQKCDASNYADNVVLFKTALQKYGHIDHAVANAGLMEQGHWFDPATGLEGVEKEPSIAVLNVNLQGFCASRALRAPTLRTAKT